MSHVLLWRIVSCRLVQYCVSCCVVCYRVVSRVQITSISWCHVMSYCIVSCRAVLYGLLFPNVAHRTNNELTLKTKPWNQIFCQSLNPLIGQPICQPAKQSVKQTQITFTNKQMPTFCLCGFLWHRSSYMDDATSVWHLVLVWIVWAIVVVKGVHYSQV